MAAACAPATAPAPGLPGAAAPAAQQAAWEKEWDDLVAAAKKEGVLQLATLTGPGYAKGAEAFEAAFPGIKVELQNFASASLLISKVTDERKANVYAWDVAQFSIISMLTTLRPTGALASVRKQLFRSDVTGDQNWNDGFANTFVDAAQDVAFMFSAEGGSLIYANTDIVNPAEIKSIRDLLKPQYKGKILWADLRTGYTYTWMWGVRQRAGDEVLKGLVVDQEPVFSRDTRQIAEAVVPEYLVQGAGVEQPLGRRPAV